MRLAETSPWLESNIVAEKKDIYPVYQKTIGNSSFFKDGSYHLCIKADGIYETLYWLGAVNIDTMCYYQFESPEAAMAYLDETWDEWNVTKRSLYTLVKI